MIDDLIRNGINIPGWLTIFLLIGILVDLFQFLWLIKRSFYKARRSVYNHVKRKLLAEESRRNGKN